MKQVTNRSNQIKHSEKNKKKKITDDRIPRSSSSIANKKRGFEQYKKAKKEKEHPKYGTSKLEDDFAHDFLDKLGLKYEYQFEAKDIGRFFDFYLPNSNLLIEIDGDYWHSNPELYEEKDLKWHQKRARIVDEYKERWALMHGIPLIRFWESDIRKNPKKVMNELKNRLHIEDEKKIIIENKKKRHNNNI